MRNWPLKPLEEVLEPTQTINPRRFPDREFDYIDVSSVSNTTFRIENTQRIRGREAPSRARKRVRKNDVLFATIRPTLRRIAIIPEHLHDQICSTGYVVLRAGEKLDHRFLFYQLFTETFMAQMKRLQKGASYPAVTDRDVRSQLIPLPPLTEQKRLADLLDRMFAAAAVARKNAEAKLVELQALERSLLHQAFTGAL